MRKSVSFLRMGLLASASLLATSLFATEVKLESSDKASGDLLGSSVAVSGDYYLTGAPGDESSKGAAYLFKKNTSGVWEQNTKFTGSDSATGDTFGTAVGISGDYAIGGAPVNDGNKGAIYLFKNTSGTWAQDSKLVAGDAAANDKYGVSVSISGDYAIVGAPSTDSSKNGAAYILKNTSGSWAQLAKLTANDGAAGDKFGASVFILGDYAAIGATGDESSKGAVYIFKNVSGTWTQVSKLAPSDLAASDAFGTSVYLNGNYLISGAPGTSSVKGCAYVFKNIAGTWTQDVKLAPDTDGANNDAFGKSVSLSGTIATIGAPNANSAAGKIFAFNKGTSSWAKTVLSFSTVSGSLGAAHVVVGNKLYMGAPTYSSSQGAGLISDFTINDTEMLFSFNNLAVPFDGSITTDSSIAATQAGTVPTTNVSCSYLDGYSNNALIYSSSANTDSTKISGLNVDWGKKIVLETKIWKGDEATGVIDLVKNTTATSTPLRWYIDSDGKMKLSLNGGTDCLVYTTNSVLTNNDWNKLYTVIDLTKTTKEQAVKMYKIPEGAPVDNYYGNSSDGSCTISSNTTWDAGASGDMIVKNFTDFTVNSGVTLTIKTRKGCMIYVAGATNVQGTIKIVNSYSCDPVAAGVPSTGLRIIRKRTGSTDTLSASDLNGCGSTAINGELNQPSISGDGKIYTISRTGATGGASRTTNGVGNAGTAGSTGMTGGGGAGANFSGTYASGAGADGTCFSGGAGGGGVGYSATTAASSGGANGGAGGNAGAGPRAATGGAGNPGGSYSISFDGYTTSYAASEGIGGLLMLFVQGNLTIGSGGALLSTGSPAGAVSNQTYYSAGGGGSGGGTMLILYGGTLSNSGTISCAGGAGSDAYVDGGAGAAGSYVLEQISASSTLLPLSSSSVYQGAFASGTANLDANKATDNAIELLKRSGAFTLKTDFLKISTMGTYETVFNSADFQGLSTSSSSYVDPSGSSSIEVNPTSMLKRVVNPPSDFTDGVPKSGVTVTYDTHPSPNSVFYGMFEVNIKLSTSDFSGTLWVDFYIQKPNESTFKKIGQVQTTKPASGDWNVKLYWNSRAAAYDWTSTDAGPWRTDGPVRFKFSVR